MRAASEAPSGKSRRGPKAKSVVVVLGMHRSGTSLLAGALQAQGVDFGTRLLEGNEWNPNGYLEHEEVVDLDDALLGRAGKRWDRLGVPTAADLLADEDLLRRGVEILRRDFAGRALCGLKDPRASRLLPFWR